jgi:hypothetical protein
MSNLHFAIAATQRPEQVLRLTLQPFSVGHKLLLERLQSPFLRADSKPLYEDLIRAALVCALPFAARRDGRLFNLKLKIWLWRARKVSDWQGEVEKLRVHIATGSLCPRIKPEGGRAPGSPWTLRLYQFLTLVLKVPPAQAWDYPYGMAQFEWCGYWEGEGSLKVWNEDDQNFENWCNEQDALAAEAESAKAKTEEAVK